MLQRCYSHPAPSMMRAQQQLSAAAQPRLSATALPPWRASAARSRKHQATRAQWGAPVEFKQAKLQSPPKQVAPDMYQLVVEVGQDVASAYTQPGQYIQAKVQADAKPGFFAIASAPGAHGPCVELLIKRAAPGSTAEALVQLGQGGAVMVSPVQGKGFPVQSIPPADVQTVLLFATGSGISPIKAVIESGVLQAGKRKEVRLYYGTRTKDATAYKDLIPKWEAAGVKVVQVHSDGTKQYVQHALEKDVAAGHFSGTSLAALVCGQKEMAQAITAVLGAQGVPKERILSNF